MPTWKLPPRKYLDNAKNYFAKFTAINETTRGFSQRNLARRLRWPVSYLPDLIHGRRKLTLSRALEFAVYFKLEPRTRDRLIFLAIGESLPKYRELIDALPAAKISGMLSTTELSHVLDARRQLVWKTLQWLHEPVESVQIADRLKRQRVSVDEVDSILELLVKTGEVEFAAGRYRAVRASTESDDEYHMAVDDEAFHSQCADFFKAYMASRIRPGCYISTFLELPPERFEVYAEKFFRIRNELLAEERSCQTSESSRRTSQLFQVDLNLTPLFLRDE